MNFISSNCHVMSFKHIDGPASTVCTRCESFILHRDGGNRGAVNRDGTKKYQAKQGLVKDDKSIKCFSISAFSHFP